MKPLIGVTADQKYLEEHYWHAAEEHYLTAVIDAAGGIPVIIPALAEALDQHALLQRLDGVLLTGGVSNIEPQRYGQLSEQDDCARDPQRDATNFGLIPRAIALGVPIFGICRGLQELNVALGGTLHQRVQVMPNKMDHRENPTVGLPEQYGPTHRVQLQAGGVLAGLSTEREVIVNSLHGQGIDRLAAGLRIEAIADDGLIEAVSLPSAAAFTVAVQWHPEWYRLSDIDTDHSPFCRALLVEFGARCKLFAQQKVSLK